MKEWLKEVPAQDREHYARIGMLSSLPPSPRSALIVVDGTLGFFGREGLSLAEATKEFPTACGPAAWKVMPNVVELIRKFREKKLPIVYTYPNTVEQAFVGCVGKVLPKSWPTHYNDFPEEIAPTKDDLVMGKPKASAFFETSLRIYLTRLNINSVVICGGSTSGCVRATGVDASSSGYQTFVIDDCCFDRSWYAHCANLFDLQAKYATVMSLSELMQQIEPKSNLRVSA